ncbi:hypothetical protein BDR06DRAFT_437906 [Suillus hirtellus]|nr:hypothetical protein BDR06DRAFT_437906 [Suillus hirtellus]
MSHGAETRTLVSPSTAYRGGEIMHRRPSHRGCCFSQTSCLSFVVSCLGIIDGNHPSTGCTIGIGQWTGTRLDSLMKRMS